MAQNGTICSLYWKKKVSCKSQCPCRTSVRDKKSVNLKNQNFHFSKRLIPQQLKNTSIDRKRDMLPKKYFAKIFMLKNFTRYEYFVKIILSCSKRQSSEKISEIEQNDVISQKLDMVSIRYFVKMFFRSRSTTSFI